MAEVTKPTRPEVPSYSDRSGVFHKENIRFGFDGNVDVSTAFRDYETYAGSDPEKKVVYTSEKTVDGEESTESQDLGDYPRQFGWSAGPMLRIGIPNKDKPEAYSEFQISTNLYGHYQRVMAGTPDLGAGQGEFSRAWMAGHGLQVQARYLFDIDFKGKDDAKGFLNGKMDAPLGVALGIQMGGLGVLADHLWTGAAGPTDMNQNFTPPAAWSLYAKFQAGPFAVVPYLDLPLNTGASAENNDYDYKGQNATWVSVDGVPSYISSGTSGGVKFSLEFGQPVSNAIAKEARKSTDTKFENAVDRYEREKADYDVKYAAWAKANPDAAEAEKKIQAKDEKKAKEALCGSLKSASGNGLEFASEKIEDLRCE